MLNHITLMGRLTRDPELRRTGSGVAVTSFTIACDRDFGQNGQKETDFIDIVAWRNTAEFVSKWFRKGQLVAVTGRIQVRSWQDRDGNNRTTTEIVADECFFAESRRDGAAAGNPMMDSAHMANNSFMSAQSDFAPAAISSDFEELIGEDTELPF